MFNRPPKSPKENPGTPPARIAHRPPARGKLMRRPSDAKASRVLGAVVIEEPQTAGERVESPYDYPKERVVYGPQRPPRESTEASSSKAKSMPLSNTQMPPSGYSFQPSASGEWILVANPALDLPPEQSQGQAEEWATATTSDDFHDFFVSPDLAPNPGLRFEHQLEGSTTFAKPFQLKVLHGTMFRLWALKTATTDILRDAAQELSRRGILTDDQQAALEDMVPLYNELMKVVAESELGKEVDQRMLKTQNTTLRKMTKKEVGKAFEGADEGAHKFAKEYA